MQQEIKTVENSFSAFADRPLVIGDKGAYFVACDTDGADSYLMVTAKRADGRVLKSYGQPANGGRATCVLDGEMYAVPGELIIRLTVFSGNEVLTVREIRAEVADALV